MIAIDDACISFGTHPLSRHANIVQSKNAYIVGHEPSLNPVIDECNSRAVILPWSAGLTIANMTMRNFNGANCTAIFGTVITCQCNKLCGGYEYKMM